MERFTQRARHVLSIAQEEADRLQHKEIDTDHLLLGLMLEDGGVAGRVLKNLGLESRQVHEMVERADRPSKPSKDSQPYLSFGTKRVLELAVEEAKRMGHGYIGTEHLLLALVRQDGKASEILRSLDISSDAVRRKTRQVLQESPIQPKSKSSLEERIRRDKRYALRERGKTSLINQLAVDLTAMAQDGKLDPVIGRELEIERVIQILSRRRKNNPALVGEPGVGKTAIVEGLAQCIIQEEVPSPLIGKKVLQLDVGSLVAGTMYRGQFEEKLKRIIEELKQTNSILFIDEVHMLVGAGSAGSSVDAANILKPALARGELQCVGATTLDEYRKYIESDQALERRFQQVIVNEPTIEETIKILQGIKYPYQDHHNVEITDDAIDNAANLSARYVPDRLLPDKAIDLIDEAASRLRMYKSPESSQVRRTENNLQTIDQQIEDLLSDLEESTEGSEEEIKLLAIEDLRQRKLTLESTLENWKSSWNPETNQPRLLGDDIAEVVSMWTGVPVMRITQAETDRLMNMENDLHKRIIGQNEAITAISKAVRRARAGLKDPRRPIGSFMFLGPTGVGKTELTKALAEFMFGSEDALTRVDMSEFMEKHSMSRLVGAPPGYIGYDEAGQLTESVRKRPYSIVVFDEIEKAHPETFNILLQIMEEGQLTDARGRRVNFRNTIIVMTSNVGADTIKYGSKLGFMLPQSEEQTNERNYEEVKKNVQDQLQRTFRPEFLNRVDSTIIFRPLTIEEIKQIVRLELKKISDRLVEYQIQIEFTDEAFEWLAERGYDSEYGARPIRRVIQQEIEDRLSDNILGNQFREGVSLRVSIDESSVLVFEPIEKHDRRKLDV